jgi:Glycosyl hydrolases family 38 C-terminal domain
VVTFFQVNDWQTEDKFYTDSNGRETLERIKNFRPTWDYDATTEPIAGNYYPITTSISIRNLNQEFAIVTDRAQGGSSNANGEIELMVKKNAEIF